MNTDQPQPSLPEASDNLSASQVFARQTIASRPPTILIVAATIWLSAVVGAMAFIVNYSNSPGRSTTIPLQWPAESAIPLDKKRPTLVMFAHPRCPCTRASIGELARLTATHGNQLNVHVLFLRPEGTSEDWIHTDLWREASRIPGVMVHADSAGTESRRFQSRTSGHTVLYDATGRLLFEGGITIARGHAGDNPGRDALAALVDQRVFNQIRTPVFGCSLFQDECQP